MELATGLGVIHLFMKPTAALDASAARAAVEAARSGGCQVVTASILGHKADLVVMALAKDLVVLRSLQTALQRAGLEVVDSYLSITEVSEYASGVPEHMQQARLYPQLPPEGMEAFCFYPMSKRRESHANWYATPYEQRLEMMMEHGKSGRGFAGRVVQLVTGSTGLDDYEWGVTLFAVNPETLKDVVYTMRFDQGSAHYAEFGPFYAGYLAPLDDIL